MSSVPNIHSIDIVKGSWLLRNTQDARRNRAVRKAHVDGLDGGRGDLDQANQLLLSSLGDTHPDDPSLPLREVRSGYWSPGETLSGIFYGHSEHSNPTQDPFSFARGRIVGERRSSELKRLHRTGVTSGGTSSYSTQTLNPGDGDQVFDDWNTEWNAPETVSLARSTRRTPIVQYTIPAGLLSSSAVASIDDMHGAFNSDAFAINGVSRAPDTLKFLYADETPVDRNGTIWYFTNYVFHWCPGGWGDWEVSMTIREGEPYQTGGLTISPQYIAWSASYDAPSPRDAFTGAFPVYTSGGSSA